MAIRDAADGGPSISRRGFLMGAAAVATIAVLPLATAEGASAATLSKAPATLTRSTFTPLLQSSFKMLNAAGQSVTVVLSEIDDLDSASAGSETRFSLIFDGPTKSARPSAVYSFRSSRLANFSLFVAPVDRGAVSRHYQAVIYTK